VLALRWGWLDGSDGAMPWKDVAARMKRSCEPPADRITAVVQSSVLVLFTHCKPGFTVCQL
jgi:hypothetical protein